eukprot:1536479-Pleurochrysis_carterae.AAC.7
MIPAFAHDTICTASLTTTGPRATSPLVSPPRTTRRLSPGHLKGRRPLRCRRAMPRSSPPAKRPRGCLPLRAPRGARLRARMPDVSRHGQQARHQSSLQSRTSLALQTHRPPTLLITQEGGVF